MSAPERPVINVHGLVWLEAQDVLAQARYLDDAFPRDVITGELTMAERRKVAGLLSLARYRLGELERRLLHAPTPPADVEVDEVAL